MTPVVVCGPHGSASTWAFNIAREMVIDQHGAAHVLSGVIQAAPGPLPEPVTGCVYKTHGWPDLPAWAEHNGAKLLLTVRDPRDCVLSVMRRAWPTVEQAGEPIEAWARLYPALLAHPGCKLVVYEDAPFDRVDQVVGIALWLGAPSTLARCLHLRQTYGTAGMRAFAAGIAASDHPADLLGIRHDPATDYQAGHIGTADLYGWYKQPPAVRAELTAWMIDRILPHVGEAFPYSRTP